MSTEQTKIEYVMVKQKDIPLIWTFAIVCKTFPTFFSVDFGDICMALSRSIITSNFFQKARMMHVNNLISEATNLT
jgi:hypothetical protein